MIPVTARELEALKKHGAWLSTETADRLLAIAQAAREARRALHEIERHCPCGARRETPETHSHVGGCPVDHALAALARTVELE